MTDLLTNPAIQSGIIPLIVAIVVAFTFNRFAAQWTGLAFAIAYYTSVYLAAGFQFYPFTSTRKILLIGIAAIVLGVILDTNKLKIKNLPLLIFIIGVAATLWILWPTLVRQQAILQILTAIAALVYTGWIAMSCYHVRNQTETGAMIALALGLGTGISAILGASALVGQLGIAIGAIAGAILLLALFNQNVKLGSTFMLPVGLLSGLLGVGVVFYASLPWYCLIPIAAIPLTNYIQLPGKFTKIKLIFLRAAFTLPFSIIAVVIAWVSTGSSESMY